MARGRDAHDAKQQAIARLGKDLARRAKSGCELCGAGDGCRPTLVSDGGEDGPELGDALLACERCRDALDGKRLPGSAGDYRFLEGTAWTEVIPVQVAAVRLLRRVADLGEAWASECLDGLWLSDDVQARLDA